MQPAFDREVLTRLPLAEAVLSLWRFVCDDDHLQELFARHRGACYEKKIPFPLLVQLVGDALLQHEGSARQSFRRAREDGQLPAALSSAYDKLGRLPPALSEAFLAEATQRLRPLAPEPLTDPIPPSLRAFEVLFCDGKAVKRVAKRLKPLRGHKGGVLGGKALAALHGRSGLAVAVATHPDGETNDAKLVPDLTPQVRGRVAGVRLWVGDRQFCDLNQAAEFTAAGDHFLVRYHPKVHFCPDPSRPPQEGSDRRGRRYVQRWGWLGRPGNPRRRYVRQVTLERPGEEAVVLVTDLVDAAAYPADDLLEAYLMRWGIEHVFQEITEVFELRHLIGTTPEGTLFQLSFCLLLYNLIQVVRGYIAAAAGRAAEAVSAELLFYDVRRQLVALYELVEVPAVVELIAPAASAPALAARLGQLLGGVWTDRWLKAPPKRKPPGPKKSGRREHTSVYRLLNAHRHRKPESPSVK
jgi:hypothetical protein